MTGVDLGAAMASVRLEAALEFQAAAASMVLLEQCEQATGQPWVTSADRSRVVDAADRWTMVRFWASAADTAAAARRLSRRHTRPR